MAWVIFTKNKNMGEMGLIIFTRNKKVKNPQIPHTIPTREKVKFNVFKMVHV